MCKHLVEQDDRVLIFTMVVLSHCCDNLYLFSAVRTGMSSGPIQLIRPELFGEPLVASRISTSGIVSFNGKFHDQESLSFKLCVLAEFERGQIFLGIVTLLRNY